MLKKLFFTIYLSLTIFLIGANFAYAYQIDPSYRPINSPFNLNYEERDAKSNTVIILQILAGAMLYFAMPIGVIMIVWSGWDMATGGADTEKIEQAKKHLTWSVLGLLLIILSYSGVRFIITFVVKSAENVN